MGSLLISDPNYSPRFSLDVAALFNIGLKDGANLEWEARDRHDAVKNHPPSAEIDQSQLAVPSRYRS